MAIQKSIVKMPLGMQTLDFWPIKEEPASSHPTYDESINLGAAVKGYLSITTASASIPGDDITQVEDQVPIQGDGAGGRHLDGAGHQLRIYEGNAPGQRPDGGRH